MCGILAIINKEKPVDLDNAKKAAKLMSHRGPDFFSIKTPSSCICLAHNRLSIIDLNQRSNQPFTSEHFHIVYNGEVYNYKELIKSHNLTPETTSDTEVVLLMYKKYGSKCLQFFNGMFSFVIFNSKTQRIFVARDRLGIKPLYYCQSKDGLIFSSEIAPIIDLLGGAEFDDFGLRQYRKLRMTIKGYTVYKNIKLFPPASFYENNHFFRYWDFDCSPKLPPTDEELSSLLNDACLLRKRADVCVGSYLSGGLDSTILSYIIKPNNTWTVGFENMNEFYWGELANNSLGSIHHKTIVNTETFLQNTIYMIKKRKEPLSVPNEVLIFLMTKNVKKHNTVVISGEGADELFWGYDRIFKWAYTSENLNPKEFDLYYSYGSHADTEVIEYALEGLPGQTTLAKIAYFFQIHHLHGLLRRLDNSTMLCSVEARVPFVDHRLVEMMAGVDFEWKMGNTFKVPLKRLFRNIIPEDIIKRPKVGFPVPLESIFYKSNEDTKIKPMDLWLKFNTEKLIQN